MDASSLIPTADALQVSRWWFEILLLVTFVLHLLFMNTMLGSAVIALVGEIRARGGAKAPVPHDISQKLPYTIAFTINLGVAPLLFIQVLYGHFIYTSSVLMGVYWLSVIGLLIPAYYGAYLYEFRYERLGGRRPPVIGASVVLLLAVAFLFTNNMTLMLRPESWVRYFDHPGGTLLNLGDPTLWPRYLHFVTASLAVGGLFVALRGQLKIRGGAANPDPQIGVQIAMGMKWFSHATMIQVLIGLWFIIALPREVMLIFMGRSPLASALLVLGAVAALVSIVLGVWKKVVPALVAAVVTVSLMVLIRDQVRRAMLGEYFSTADLPLEPQLSPLILFLVTFVAGLAMVAWMLVLAARTGKEARR